MSSGDLVANSRRLDYLDSLRGLAIFLVIVCHSNSFSQEFLADHKGRTSTPFYNLLDLGKYGVELFFVISGYLIAELYGKNPSTFRVKVFWKKRFARIYPLWFLFLVFYIVSSSFGLVIHGSDGPLKHVQSSHNLLLETFFLGCFFLFWIKPNFYNSVIPGGWSIQTEFNNYLIFAIFRKIKLNKLMMMMIIGNFVVSVLDFVFVERPNYPTNNSFLFIFIKTIVRLNASAYFSFFLLGYVANFFGNQTSIRISNKYCGLGPKLISLFLISLVMVPNYHGNSISALGVIFISVLVNYFLSPIHWYGTIFSSIGKYSYSMYYIHLLYFLLIKKFVKFQKLTLSNPIFQPSMFMLFFLSAITISFFLASLSYKVIERPILNLARKNSSF